MKSVLKPYLRQQQGAVALIITFILLFVLALIVLFTTNIGLTDFRASKNDYKNKQAFEAADAGIEYGIAYLQSNSSTVIVDADSNGFIDTYTNASIKNVPQNNSSHFSIVYSNPTANDYKTILITSVGTSDDAAVTETITQLLHIQSFITTDLLAPLIAKSSVAFGGNMSITNLYTNINIWSGGTTTLSGSAITVTSSGKTSTKNGLGSDVVQNDTDLASMTNDQFFQTFFSETVTQVKASADVYYSNTVDTNYSTALNGLKGKLVWIDQSSGTAAQFNSNVTIGSPTSPVILIVNGDLKVSGTTDLYGVLYVMNDWANSGGGTFNVYGSAIIQGNISGTGTPNVYYDPNILNRSQNVLGDYAKVSGGWIDF